MSVVHNSPLAQWERGAVWTVAENLTMLAVPLLWLLLTGRSFADYGLSTANLKEQWDATVRCGVPFAAFAVLFFVGWGRYLVVMQFAIGFAALFLFGFLLRNPRAPSAVVFPCVLLAIGHHASKTAAAGFLFYVFLLGPSEEILFRGVIQSRLNLAFGRRFTFFGARWGWGAMIACAIFALVHVVNVYALYSGQWQPVWMAGPVIFCLALPLAFLRERTGGVLAPALLHALPQAIAFAVRTMAVR